MFSGESKKRPTVSLRGKSKEEDRGEFLRRARAQRQERARERLHASCATTIQRIWRGRSCVGKWREAERNAWDRKMHDVGRVKSMLAAAGKVLQLPPPVLQTLLSQLVNFHSFPRDAGRLRAAVDLVLAAAPSDDATGGTRMAVGLFAPAAPVGLSGGADQAAAAAAAGGAWSLLVARLGAICLDYIGQAAMGVKPHIHGGGKGDAMDDVDGSGAAVVVGVGTSEVGSAAEAASRGFELLASPGAWRNRWPVDEKAAAEDHCRTFLVSLALGKLLLGTGVGGHEGAPQKSGVAPAKTPPPAREKAGSAARTGVRLSVRAERDGVSGEWVRTPRLFGVLRVVWDASAAGAGAGAGDPAGAAQVVRLLCGASFRALGMGGAPAVPATTMETALVPPLAGAGDMKVKAENAAAEKSRRLLLLEAFAAAILPAPRLLDHPLRESLVGHMLAGDGEAWWELVSVAGEAVGVESGEAGGGAARGAGGAAAARRRRDVAWAVANVLRVDTGGGAERAPCLVRTLCVLLRKVSLHALLQGAGARGAAGGGQMGGHEVDDVEEDDDEDIMMDEAFSNAAADRGGAGAAPTGGGGGGGWGGANNDVVGGGIRLEAIVRRHRRRCAVRTESLAAEQLSPPRGLGSSGAQPSSGSKRRDMAGGGGGGGGGLGEREREAAAAEATAMVSGEVEAMTAAASRLADPAVVGRLFDSILPPVARFSSQQQQQQQQRQQAGRYVQDARPEAAAEREAAAAGGRRNSGGGGGGGDGDDPVLSLCSLYADLVMDGVRAGSASASASAAPAPAPASSGGAAGDSSPSSPSSSAAMPSAPGKSVLNALAFGRPNAPIAARLWAYLQRRQALGAHSKEGGSGAAAAAGGGTASADGKRGGRGGGGGGGGRVQSALFLFCSACSHQLLALDDEEFYEKQRPLTLEEVRQLAGFLKEWLCRMYWSDPIFPRLLDESLPSDPAAALRQCEERLREALLLLSATRLFNQLYERNTRRSFLDAESWYWKAISASELSPPDRGDPRVAFLSRGNLGMVLTNIPQVVPFFQRVGIFRQMIDAERGEHQGSSAFHQSSSRVRVSRETLYEDSAEELTKLGSALKGRIQVTFMNQHGVEEAGIDGGGVFKEYMDLLTKRAFDPQYALFVATEDQYLFPNPAAPLVTDDYLFHFEFLGRVLAKAVFEDILVEPQFSPVFLNKLLGRYNYIDDLYSLDPELYRNLMQLKTIVHDGGDVADLCLTFSATTTAFGESKVWDLIPGGRDVAVTNASVISYIHKMAHFKLNVQTARPCKAFMQGFRDLIPVEWIRLFNPQELQRLIGGEGGRGIDVEDLKRNTLYAGGYHQSQPVMKWFWEAIESFNPEEQGQFLKFVTSCSRPPLLGFERLNPPICLQRVPEGEGGRLPSSATCMNLLKLPQYSDRQTLREKLLYAISANAGFELT